MTAPPEPNITDAELAAAIRAHLCGAFPDRAAEIEAIDPSASLFDLGLLDSLAFLSLVELVEQQAGIVVPPDDFTPTRLGTIAALVDYAQSARR